MKLTTERQEKAKRQVQKTRDNYVGPVLFFAFFIQQQQQQQQQQQKQKQQQQQQKRNGCYIRTYLHRN